MRFSARHYLVGLAQNIRILKMAKPTLEQAQQLYEATQEKQKLFTEFNYQAGTWKAPRRVIVKVEHNRLGNNLRCLVTNMNVPPQELYEQNYSPRGDMENDIKQQKLDLRADRCSSHEFMVNQFRMLLSGFAYLLFQHMSTTYLKHTKYANSYCKTIRLKLFKIGAIIIKNTRSIKFLFSSAYTEQQIFTNLVKNLESG